jgi:predicted LPLAT superfamily acyltransferase
LELRERIEAGEWVVIAGDRVPLHGGRTTPVSLLGDEAPVPIGPYVLAALLGCPVYLMFCLRRAGQNTVYFEKFAERIGWERRERDSVIAGLARRYAARLEYYIGLSPLQWFNFYPFWSGR